MTNSDSPSRSVKKREELIRMVLDGEYLKDISQQDFLSLGVDHVVYIKPDLKDGTKTTYAIHAADGTFLSSHDNAEIAAMLAVSNDMAPVTLH